MLAILIGGLNQSVAEAVVLNGFQANYECISQPFVYLLGANKFSMTDL